MGGGHVQEALIEVHVFDEKSQSSVTYANISFIKTLKRDFEL